jgi:hypothetical protein
MEMKKYFLLTICTIFLFDNHIDAQQYEIKSLKIESFENREQTIKIKYEISRNCIVIKLLSNDSICITDILRIISAQAISKNFIKIQVESRGGTGVGRERTILLCVSENKLFSSLDIESLSTHLDQIEYEVKFQSIIPIRSDYNLKVKVSSNINSSSANQALREDTVQLFFEPKLKIFYNNLKDSPFKSERNLQSNPKLNIQTEKCPYIKLLDYEYYFFEGSWYMREIPMEFYKIPIRCGSY